MGAVRRASFYPRDAEAAEKKRLSFSRRARRPGGGNLCARASKQKRAFPKMRVAVSDGPFERKMKIDEDEDQGRLAKFGSPGPGKCHTERVKR